MFCYNCKKEIEEKSYFCPFCGAKQGYKPKWVLIISIISLGFAFIAIHEIIMIIGIVLGIVSIFFTILLSKKNLTNIYAIVFAIAGVLANLSWLIFTLYIL